VFGACLVLGHGLFVMFRPSAALIVSALSSIALTLSQTAFWLVRPACGRRTIPPPCLWGGACAPHRGLGGEISLGICIYVRGQEPKRFCPAGVMSANKETRGGASNLETVVSSNTKSVTISRDGPVAIISRESPHWPPKH